MGTSMIKVNNKNIQRELLVEVRLKACINTHNTIIQTCMENIHYNALEWKHLAICRIVGNHSLSGWYHFSSRKAILKYYLLGQKVMIKTFATDRVMLDIVSIFPTHHESMLQIYKV